MTKNAQSGLLLALFGTLVLTPDALLMRLSGMDGFQMAGWRGLFMGTVMVLVWAVTTQEHRADLRRLFSGPGMLIALAQVFNSLFFCLGIAMAPVAIVLIGVAAVPVFAAVLGRLVIGEAAGLGTWLAIYAVMFGVAVAVLGEGSSAVALDWRSLLGAAFGLGTAFVLAMNFVTLRARPDLPILLAIGCGAWGAGLLGWAVTGAGGMLEGDVWAMAVTGLIILPVSFFALSVAARHTLAANVSLLMLLETVLAPFWVWLVLHEEPGMATLIGGAIVIISLALYLLWQRRHVGHVAR